MIAFDSNVAGSFDIYVIPSDGGRPLQLTNNQATDAIPSWSRNSRWIYFTSWRTGRAEVWKIRANGGSETRVTRDGGSLAAESTDGRYLYFVRGDENSGDLFRMQIDGGHATKVLSSVRGRIFTVFANGVYSATGSPQPELRYLEFATGSVRVIAPLPGMPHADLSSDENWLCIPSRRCPTQICRSLKTSAESHGGRSDVCATEEMTVHRTEGLLGYEGAW
jgi:hypothetical protein